jgi:hypothetical protein
MPSSFAAWSYGTGRRPGRLSAVPWRPQPEKIWRTTGLSPFVLQMGSACRLAVTGAFRLLAHDDRVPHLHLAYGLLRPFARGVVRTEEEDSWFWRHDRAQPWVTTSCCTRAWTALRIRRTTATDCPLGSASGQSTTHTSSYDPETVTLTMRTCPPTQPAGQTARDAVGR